MREEWCSLGKSWKRGVEEKNEKEVEVTWQRVRRGGRMGNSEHKCIWTRTRWSCCRCTCGLSCSVMSDSLQLHGLSPARLLCPWDSPGKNTGVGCYALPQSVFPTHWLNPGLPHCRQILYHLSHQENPRILERIAHPLSRGSSWPRNRAGVSCIAGGFFTSLAMEASLLQLLPL